jgi:5-methylcytosine-specific restriction endonuclease McrA
MAKYAFTSIQRMAIWKAHKSKCAYCGKIIPFNDLEIDHILPESLLGNSDKLERTKLEYGLDSEFDINSYYNWIPSCKSCNKRKSNRPFSESSARFYIEMVARPRYEK